MEFHVSGLAVYVLLIVALLLCGLVGFKFVTHNGRSEYCYVSKRTETYEVRVYRPWRHDETVGVFLLAADAQAFMVGCQAVVRN